MKYRFTLMFLKFLCYVKDFSIDLFIAPDGV